MSRVTDPRGVLQRGGAAAAARVDGPAMPPLSSLRNAAVEDPFNVWIHRPLAYAITCGLFRSSVSPNAVTLFAMLLGVLAGVSLGVGTAFSTVMWVQVAGVLLWTSAIFDGVDGMLARARGVQSVGGRALDGTADAVVALATVVPAVNHLIEVHGFPVQTMIFLAPWVIGLTIVQLSLSDFYKEKYLGAARHAASPSIPQSGLVRVAYTRVFLPYLRAQRAWVTATNPDALRPFQTPLYRKKNRGPMRLWAWLSLAPHTYLMAASLLLGRLDGYFYLRVLVFPLLLAVALVWQNLTTRACQSSLPDERSVHV